MPDCLCGHPYRQHREGGACTRCPACAIFEPKDDPTAKRDMEQVLSAVEMARRKKEQESSLEVTIRAVTPENIHPEIDIGPPVGLEAAPLPAPVTYPALPEQASLWEHEPPEFPMEMPKDDRDASKTSLSHEDDPWWLDA